MHYVLEPEVAGSIGNESVIDTSIHPPNVTKLHLQIDGWLGDEIIETFPCYIVTENLFQQLKMNNLTGYEIDEIKVTVSDQFQELYPNKELPKFVWLKIVGVIGVDDLSISEDHMLIASYKALEVLRKCQLNHCDVESYEM